MYYELRNGLMKVAYPVFVDGTEIARSGCLPGQHGRLAIAYGVNRRQELAKLIMGSPLLSEGDRQPDVGPLPWLWIHQADRRLRRSQSAVASGLLDGLAERFREYSFDLKELMRWIVLSEPYALSSRIDAATRPTIRRWASRPGSRHFYLRQMQAEQLYESLLTATEADQTRDGLRMPPGEGSLAGAVRDRLRDRRRRRGDHVQRIDSAGPDDVQRRPDQEGHERGQGRLSRPGRQRSQA